MDIVEEVEIECPHCLGRFTIEVETTTRKLDLIEDCAVCCAPVSLQISCKPGEVTGVQVSVA